jgi:hypothetical protein
MRKIGIVALARTNRRSAMMRLHKTLLVLVRWLLPIVTWNESVTWNKSVTLKNAVPVTT